MGLLDLFKKPSLKDQLRLKIRQAFNDAVKDASKNLMNDPMMDGLLVQAAIGELYQSLKGNRTMQVECAKQGFDYESLLEEECNRALKTYLQ